MASFILFRSNSTKQPKMANPYEAPGCQEANDPYERIFFSFPRCWGLATSASGVVS
jgi:hypothetical protein